MEWSRMFGKSRNPDKPVGDIVSANVFLDIYEFKYKALISKFITCIYF